MRMKINGICKIVNEANTENMYHLLSRALHTLALGVHRYMSLSNLKVITRQCTNLKKQNL